MSEKKQKLELTLIGKEKRPRHGQAKSLEILAKVAAVGPMKKSGADDGRARSPSAPPAADGKAVAHFAPPVPHLRAVVHFGERRADVVAAHSPAVDRYPGHDGRSVAQDRELPVPLDYVKGKSPQSDHAERRRPEQRLHRKHLLSGR